MIWEYFKLALTNLSHRRMRSYLTMIGIFIGIAAVVALVSLGQGLQQYISETFAAVGTDKIMIMPGRGLLPPGTALATELTENDVQTVEKVPGIDSAGGMVLGSVKISGKDKAIYSYAASIPETDFRDTFMQMTTVEVEIGRMLEKGERGKIMIGADYVRRNLLKEDIRIGGTIKINDQEFRVVGVLGPIGNPSDDSSVYMNEPDARDVFNAPERFDYIYAKTAAGEDTLLVAGAVERALRRSRNVEKGKEDFSVQTLDQLIESFNVVFAIVQAVVFGIAGISLLVGGIGIMNTMYTAVLERTKEIGIMKAIGAKNTDVLLIFLIESGMLGTVGGAIGIAIGMGLGKLVEIGAAQALGTALLRAYFPLYLIVGTLLFSFIVGSASGLFPAMQAARMEPVEALKKKY